jgi:hypothetical protein
MRFGKKGMNGGDEGEHRRFLFSAFFTYISKVKD